MSKTDKTVYEIGFNLIPIISPEDAIAEALAIKEKITSLGGEIISEENPSLIKLAYEMTKEIDNKNVKFDSAYFGWVKFELSPEDVAEINKLADSNSKMLRFIIIKTVRENTLYASKFTKQVKKDQGEDEGKIVPVIQTETLPMNEAEVDKKIDELVTEDEAGV